MVSGGTRRWSSWSPQASKTQCSPPQGGYIPRSSRERERERERLRRESETEEEEERVLGEISDGEESDDTAYDRRHAIPPCELP